MLGGMVLALPVAIKIIPALPVGFILLAAGIAWLKKREPSSRRQTETSNRQKETSNFFLPGTTGFATGLFLFFLLIPAMFLGWNRNLDLLQYEMRLMSANVDDGGDGSGLKMGNSRSIRNQSLQNGAFRLGGDLAYYAVGGVRCFLHGSLLTRHQPARIENGSSRHQRLQGGIAPRVAPRRHKTRQGRRFVEYRRRF